MRRATALVALGYLIAGTSLAGAQAIPKIKFEKYTLPNGLEVILHEDHSTPIVTVNTWYKVGSGDEKTGRTGFAHLFEHIMTATPVRSAISSAQSIIRTARSALP